MSNSCVKCRGNKKYIMDNFSSNNKSSNMKKDSIEPTLSTLLLEKAEATEDLLDDNFENKESGCVENVFKCKQCLQTFSHKNHFDKHIKGHNRNSCTVCKANFPKRKALCKHLKTEHNILEPEKKYKCRFCKEQLSKKSHYLKHLESHANGQHFCSKCGFMCKEEIVYTEHVNEHSKVADHKCDLCGKQFIRKQQFNQHMLGHEKHTCSQCDATVSTKKLLMKHKKDAHGIPTIVTKPFRCSVCEKSFFRAQHLKLHMSVHTGEKPVRCYECDKSFCDKRWLAKHKQSFRHLQRVNNASGDGKIVEIERPYSCNECSSKFYSQHGLSRHIELSHSLKETFKCNICAYSSKCKTNFKRHMEIHEGVRRFICEVCGLSFRAKATLKDHHSLVHSEKRSFTCNLCQKSFKSKSILQRHVKNHSEARPYKCHCNRDFKRLSHLKRHLTCVHHTSKDDSQVSIVSSPTSPRSDFSVESNILPVAFLTLSSTKLTVINNYQLLPESICADPQVPLLLNKNETSCNALQSSLENLIAVTTPAPPSETDDNTVTSFDEPNLNLSPSHFCNFDLRSSTPVDNMVSDIQNSSPSSSNNTRPQSLNNLNLDQSSMEALTDMLTDSSSLQMPPFLQNSSPSHINDFILDPLTSEKKLFENSDDTLSLPPFSCSGHLNDTFGMGRDIDLWDAEEKLKQDSDEDGTSVGFSDNLMTHGLLFPNEPLITLDENSLNSDMDTFSNLC